MIEFVENGHLYLYNGVIIPSVSQVLSETKFKDKYKGIPIWILENKAEYGTRIHLLVELYEKKEIYSLKNVYEELSLNQYTKLKEQYNIKVLEQEKIVCYKGLYAGRFDMIAEVNGITSLIDIKTTSKLDKDYISWQLSLYELASGKKFDKFYCLWLPKGGIAKLVEIEKVKEKDLKEFIEKEVKGKWQNTK